jgi:hypothetical protein
MYFEEKPTNVGKSTHNLADSIFSKNISLSLKLANKNEWLVTEDDETRINSRNT